MPQRIAITGSSGMIGGALSAFLAHRGDTPLHLVRRPVRGPHEIEYDPAARRLDATTLDDVDAVVNLAGAGVGDKRWTPDYKRVLVSSRIDTTATVATALADVRARTGRDLRLVNGSAVGYYGQDRGEEDLSEDSSGAAGFLAQLTDAWESAADPAVQAGVSVAYARTGTMVLSPDEGPLPRVLTLTKMYVGGPLGSGKQYWSWISLTDEVRALAFLLDHPEITGPVNLTAPAPSRQKEFAAELGRQFGRPSFVPAPSIALHLVLGEFAGAILGSQKVLPVRLLGSGFEFTHPSLESALSWVATHD